MKANQASFPAFGIDTVLRLNAQQAKALAALGYTFAVRYLGGLTSEERAVLLAAGLAVMPVTYSRKPGWVPSADLGRQDGDKTVLELARVGLPPGVTVWLDLEGCAGPAADTAAWVNEWAAKVAAAGYQPGLYVGAQPGGLDADALWQLTVVRYWRSCSRVPEPANCGFCMTQLYPPNILVAGIRVVVDVVHADWKGRLPTWAAR